MEDSKTFIVRFCGTTQLDGENTGLQLPMKRDEVSLTSASSEVDEVREKVVKKLASFKAIQELKQVMCEMVSWIQIVNSSDSRTDLKILKVNMYLQC